MRVSISLLLFSSFFLLHKIGNNFDYSLNNTKSLEERREIENREFYRYFGEDSLVIFTPCLTVAERENFCVDFKVKNFLSILSTHLEIRYDESILTHTRTEFNTAIPALAADKFITVLGDREMILDWDGIIYQPGMFNSFEGHTLPDSTTFFTMCFQAKIEGSAELQANNSWVQSSPLVPISQSIESLKINFCTIKVKDNHIQANIGDSLSLISLHRATNGFNWLRTWNLYEPMELWHGVTLNEEGRVVDLSLIDNRLEGVLPPEIGNLIALEHLELSKNRKLTGSIPPEIGNLINLHTLKFNGTDFQGDLPSEIGKLLNLIILDLSFNDLTSIPSEIGNYLINLQHFDLSFNNLTTLLPELGNLISLQNFDLSHNNLSGSIPSEIGNLINLEILDLSSNNLSGSIPSEIGNLINLGFFYLSSNNLSGSIPSEIGNLANLQTISLTDNDFTGSIPKEIGELTHLKSINLSKNNLIGNVPSVIGNLTNLEYLGLSENALTGSLPPEIGNLTNLKDLNLYSNNLTGNIPSEIGNLINIERIQLSANNLSGSVPSEINSLTQPNIGLYLSDNNFSSFPILFLSTIDISIRKNYLTFKDIIPNLKYIEKEDYVPQKEIFLDSIIEIDRCNVISEIDLAIDEDIESNKYSWFKNGTSLLTSNKNKLRLDEIYDDITSYSGIYTCEVTNPLVPDLVLTTGDIKIIINEEIIPDTTFISRDICLGENIYVEGDFFDCTKPNSLFFTTDSITGCLTAYVIQLNCQNCQETNDLSIPTAFSPNGDNFNETFLIPAILESPNQPNILTVYNQQGQQVFVKENYQNEWRGTDNTGNVLPIGTYYYVFEFGEGQPQKGLVTIIR